jgi:hypothetical protein
MFTAMGSCAFFNHVCDKSSACVEVLCRLAHEVTDWVGVSDFHQHRTQVSIDADIKHYVLISQHKMYIPSLQTERCHLHHKRKPPKLQPQNHSIANHAKLVYKMFFWMEW